MEIVYCYSKEQRKAHERDFIEQTNNTPGWEVLDHIEHPSGIKKGDMVVVRNGYGHLVGPYKVLGFKKKSDGRRQMYLDWSCWWCPVDIERIQEERKEAAND